VRRVSLSERYQASLRRAQTLQELAEAVYDLRAVILDVMRPALDRLASILVQFVALFDSVSIYTGEPPYGGRWYGTQMIGDRGEGGA
jgi:hypothetical protein